MFAEHEGTLSQVHLTGFDVGYEEERDEPSCRVKEFKTWVIHVPQF